MKVVHINYSCVIPVNKTKIKTIVIEINSYILVFIADLLIYYPAVFCAYRFDVLNKNLPTKKVHLFFLYSFFYCLLYFLVYCIINKSFLSFIDIN
jgi:hypothetical protein